MKNKLIVKCRIDRYILYIKKCNYTRYMKYQRFMRY